MTDQTETTQTLYRIYWRNETTGKSGHSTGLYTEAEVKVWLPALNRDKANIKLGLTHWVEPVEK